MSIAHREGALKHALDFRAWPIRENTARLNAYVLAVVFVDLASIAIAAVTTTFTYHQLMLFGFACLCSAWMVEATKKAGENAGWIKDIYGIWELPIAVLLPPLYALLVPIPHIALSQLRVKHIPHSVAEEIEGQHGKCQGSSRSKQQPGIVGRILPPGIAHHRAPARGGWRRTDAKEA